MGALDKLETGPHRENMAVHPDWLGGSSASVSDMPPRYASQYPARSRGIDWEIHDLTVNIVHDCVVPAFILAIGTPLVSRNLADLTLRTNVPLTGFSCELPFLVEAPKRSFSHHRLATKKGRR